MKKHKTVKQIAISSKEMLTFNWLDSGY
uniref:Uncharacterized protein n=1 Tax=Rhizophora mucronata TaxID=61149 RepID=A0A2P2JGU9_RHIMU